MFREISYTDRWLMMATIKIFVLIIKTAPGEWDDALGRQRRGWKGSLLLLIVISWHLHHLGQLLSPSYFIIKSPWYFSISCMNIFISLSLLRSYCVMDDTGVHLLPRSDVLWAIRRGYILMTSMAVLMMTKTMQWSKKLNNLNLKSFLRKNKHFKIRLVFISLFI